MSEKLTNDQIADMFIKVCRILNIDNLSTNDNTVKVIHYIAQQAYKEGIKIGTKDYCSCCGGKLAVFGVCYDCDFDEESEKK
jgi:hypothetical protein